MSFKTAFLISPVRNLRPTQKKRLDRFVDILESRYGWEIHLPYRDTEQEMGEMVACTGNKDAIASSKYVLVWYASDSGGTIFDLGMTFSLDKPLIICNYYMVRDIAAAKEGKSFENLMIEWDARSHDGNALEFEEVTDTFTEVSCV